MKNSNLQKKIHRIIWSIAIAFTMTILIIVCFFLSSNQWNQTMMDADTSLSQSANHMNIQLEILTKYKEIIAENPLIHDYFSENYESIHSAVNATFSINNYFQTFYNSYNGTNTDIYIYHSNKTLPLSLHSRYIEDLDKELREKILNLRLNEFIWENTDDSTILYSNMTRKTGPRMILAIPVTDKTISNILGILDLPYDSKITVEEPSEDQYIYLSKKLINGQYISVRILESEKRSVYLRNFLLIVLLATMLFTLIYTTSKKITTKITKNLYEFIDYLMVDNQYLLTHTINIESDNEFKNLFMKINQLVNEINNAHNDAEELRRRNSSLQLYHMQYQINPHLLYNALSALKWETMQYGNMIPDKIDALADYYRLSLNQPTEGYSFKSEVEMIKKYINLLSLIHNFDYKYSIELNETILSTATIPHILQPFVENAILHGINRLENGIIRISGRICAHPENVFVEIILEDNGYGIGQEKLKQIQNIGYEPLQTSGLGIRNTISRIRLYYGQDSTVKITSKENHGTSILLKFPVK